MDEQYKKTIRRLRGWLKNSPFSLCDIADKLGISFHALSSKIHRTKLRPFAPKEAVLLEALTNGEFLAAELLKPLTPDGYIFVSIEYVDPSLISRLKSDLVGHPNRTKTVASAA